MRFLKISLPISTIQKCQRKTQSKHCSNLSLTRKFDSIGVRYQPQSPSKPGLHTNQRITQSYLRKKQAPKPKEPEPFVRYYKGQKKNYDSNTAKAPWDGSSFESQARAEQNQSEYHKTFYSKPVNIRFYFP